MERSNLRSGLSNNLLAQLYNQNSDDPFLTLIELDHATFPDTIRLVNNTVDIVSRGNTYTAFPVEITLPADDGTTIRSVNITFDNVSLELIDEFRQVTNPIDTKLEMVLASDPDTVEIELAELKISNISYNAQTVSAELFLDDFLNTELSSEKYTPTLYPGLFT